MCIDGLKQAKYDPQVHGQDVQVASDSAPNDRADDGPESKAQDLNRACVLSGESKRSRILVMELVNCFVQTGRVQASMGPVVPGVLHDEKDGDLIGDLEGGGEGYRCLQATELSHGMEKPDLG